MSFLMHKRHNPPPQIPHTRHVIARSYETAFAGHGYVQELSRRQPRRNRSSKRASIDMRRVCFLRCLLLGLYSP